MGEHNHQKKIASINDISGFGRCSITVSMPIVSYMKIQMCPVPTAIFSNHTAYPNYYCDDYTDRLPEYIDNWRKLDLNFQGIMSGYLGSEKQIEIVKDFIRNFATPETIVVVDPVMGDNGKTYIKFSQDHCERMKTLAESADILTPNITEACILTGKKYKEEGWSAKELKEMAMILNDLGPDKVVITGIRQGSYIANYVSVRGVEPKVFRTQKINRSYSGTGDIFASIIAADAVNGVDFYKSVRKASVFIKRCIKKSIEMDIPKEDGVCFEELLHTLKIN